MSLSSLKNTAKRKLNREQIELLKNLVQPPWLYSSRSKHLIIILGCQRSGTTLTYLILNSHSQIKGIDETESNYCFPHPSILAYNWMRGYTTCLKLPNQTFNLEHIVKYFPQAKIIWLLRNPYAVVSSMRKFQTNGGNWLNRYAKQELLRESLLIPEILSLDLENLDEVSLGAMVWRYKNIALEKYKNTGLNIFTVKYEELLDRPQQVIANMLEFANLEWNDNVLNHHQHYRGKKKYPGGTKGNIAIDKSRKKPDLALSESEIKAIELICKEYMKVYGYYF